MIHSSTDGHLGCFQHLAMGNCAAVNIGAPVVFKLDSLGLQVPGKYYRISRVGEGNARSWRGDTVATASIVSFIKF